LERENKMNARIVWLMLACITLLFVDRVYASEGPYIEYQYMDYHKNYGGHVVYGEQKIGDYFLLAYGYKDPEYSQGAVGFGRYFGNAQIGIATGRLKYHDTTDAIFSGFYYYEDDLWEASVIADYNRDTSDAWYQRSYIHRKVWQNVFVGAYSERWFGHGPMLGVGWELGSLYMEAFATRPIAHKGGSDNMISLRLSYQF